MEVEDIKWFKNFKKRYDGSRLDSADYDVLCKLHANYFNHSFYKPCSCNGGKTIKKWAQDLNNIYEKYE